MKGGRRGYPFLVHLLNIYSKILQENTNKKENKTFLDDREGIFSLYIINVSRKNVGNYTCLAKVNAGIGKTNDDEDYVKLSLDKKGEFHLLLLLL